MSEQPQGRTIRRVTGVDVIRRAQNGQSGSYELELELDGTEQFVLTVPDEELNTVLRLFHRSGSVIFNQGSQELTFEGYGAGS